MPITDYISETKSVLSRFIRFIDSSPWRGDYYVQLQQLMKNIDDPCRLAIAGRVKAGKSSLVNTLLGVNLAKVGTTETTATINVFKYGIPPDSSKPVLCQYCNGHEEWVTKEFLDSLQGTTSEGLKKASEIKNMVYYVNDLRLQNVILIDTPGINAVVDDHVEQTELYLGLRQRHNEETIEISNEADAVVYLLGEIASGSNQDFLGALRNTLGQKSSINTIGVMSQIDLRFLNAPPFNEYGEPFNKEERAKEIYHRLSSYLSTVVPISAGLKLYLPSREEAIAMKQILMKFGSEDNILYALSGGVRLYESKDLHGIKVSVEERKLILKHGMPWGVFVLIAWELYKHNVDTALSKLDEYSGISNLNTILEQHFFARSKIIRCNNAVYKLDNILNNILKYGGLDELKEESALKDQCLEACANLSPEISALMKKIIEKHLKSALYIQDVEKELMVIKEKIRIIKLMTGRINDDFYCLQLLNDNRKKFRQDEMEELTELFAYNTSKQRNESRRAYWQDISSRSMSEEKRMIAERASHKYDEL
jgi:hypothetical protein